MSIFQGVVITMRSQGNESRQAAPPRRESTCRMRPPTRWRQGAFEATYRQASRQKGGKFLSVSTPCYHGRVWLTFRRRGDCLVSRGEGGESWQTHLKVKRRGTAKAFDQLLQWKWNYQDEPVQLYAKKKKIFPPTIGLRLNRAKKKKRGDGHISKTHDWHAERGRERN